MKTLTKILSKHWKKGIVSLVATAGFFVISLIPETYKALSLTSKITIFLFLGSLNTFGPAVVDEFKFGQLIKALRGQKRTLEKLLSASSTEITELHSLISRFINHSIIYKEDVIEKLNIEDEFLCIVKSDEGFQKIWDDLEEKEMLPFTKVLHDLPGSIRPFARQGLFIIPIKELPGFNKSDIRKFIKKNILPQVKKERKVFLSKLTRAQKKDIGKFSFKYLAFVLRKNSLDYDTQNRKFSQVFTQFIVSNQAKRTVAGITNDLTQFITGKEIFSLIDWEAFISDLNNEQSELIQLNKESLLKMMKRNKIRTIVDLSNVDINILQSILENVFKEKTTKIKSKNLAEKITMGAQSTVRILRTTGAKI